MLTVLVIIYVLASILLITVILLKDPGDESLGRMFGGGSNTKSYSKSKLDPVEKLVRTLAIVFAVSCLMLVMVLNRGNDSSVLDTVTDSPLPINSRPAENPEAQQKSDSTKQQK